MNSLILIGFDLVVSAALILLAMYVVWSRVQSRLESLGGKESDPPGGNGTPKSNRKEPQSVAKDALGEWEFGDVTEQATALKQKGCSLEEIAQRLQLPTREVEVVLAISEMSRIEPSAQGVSVPLQLNPEEAFSSG